ncbi:hypothetical protein [Thermoflavimicrobium dichotomicum]|uniref:Uncharacterized protein n=1 Tax=Thermoflavimicrobium dichotomicum TaxID=46223 RepID=A0A1I3MUI2_9BACL|nr:hypothetical protein [Thermoflavimicrobium dichotomicum]SFJ00602.1 hypothetical protein SAMN05421852_103206 [Thermoflavimicrobium dichotomicum]
MERNNKKPFKKQNDAEFAREFDGDDATLSVIQAIQEAYTQSGAEVKEEQER